MRADRLLVLLMLLQTRGRVTAQSLAKRLEVSERTIYRDLEALGMAGVPVYAERGPGGGWRLLEDYRTNLSRLTEAEVHTLFLSGAEGPLQDLGLGKTREDALLKLLAALPSVYRRNAEMARQRVHLDATSWFHHEEAVPYLPLLQEAVWNDRRLYIVYRHFDESIAERHVNPYGLVAKASIWYLVGTSDESGGEMRVYRVGRIQSAEMLPEHFERPQDFNLPEFWRPWIAAFEKSRYAYRVTLRVAGGYMNELAYAFGDDIHPAEQATDKDNDNEQITLSLQFESLSQARARLFGLGTRVEVLEPLELRESLAQFAAEIAQFYGR
ncbi:MAG TPA: WYL domain-containing protein [Ktedonobacteraceae bacterium]|nr:WYL domain-containing protein [Ktedonobacteraceae bacterium]